MLKPNRFKLILLLAVACLNANPVHGAVIETMEFSGLIGVGESAQFVSSPYLEAGFVLTTPGIPSQEFTARRREVGGVIHDAFSARLPNQILLQKNDGGFFSLTSIDLARATLLPSSPPISVTFTGMPNTGPLVSQTLTITEAEDFETFTFNSSFSNLSSVTWNQVGGPSDHLFDNVTLQVSAVPEPTSLAFLGVGLGSVAGIRRVRQTRFANAVV